MKKQTFNITGMSCAACQANITKNVEKLDGINKVQVNLITNKMIVEFNENIISEENIINTVISIGYGASSDSESKKEPTAYNIINNDNKTKKIKLIISIILLFPLMYLAMGHMIGFQTLEFLNMHTNPISYSILLLILTIPFLIL